MDGMIPPGRASVPATVYRTPGGGHVLRRGTECRPLSRRAAWLYNITTGVLTAAILIGSWALCAGGVWLLVWAVTATGAGW